MNRHRTILAPILALLISATSWAAAPTQMAVQGRLTDLAGAPLPAGPKSIGFRIFSDSTAGTQIWPASSWEFQSVTSANDGLWIAMVGALIPLTDPVFSNTARWLEVSVDMTIMPRIRLATGPYAYRVATVDGASGGTITSKVSIGSGHTNSGNDAFVTGADNQVTANYSAIGGGALNLANGESGVIAGGQQNKATGFASSVGGGQSNTSSGTASVVDGGKLNTASGVVAAVGGGGSNLATDSGAAVGGGGYNRARGYYSTVAGGGGENPGDSNSALGRWSTISGGTENLASGWASTIGGGFVNYAQAEGATIGGGVANAVTGVSAVIAGGNSGAAMGDFSTISGGLQNRAADTGATVAGGANNRCRGLYSTIGGGGGSDAEDSNSITSWWSTIGGGARNASNGGIYATIGGGIGNRAHYFDVVGGGGHNFAYGGASTISGGEFNNASGGHATVVGGYQNRADGEYASVAGGSYNVASGRSSFAAGRYAYSLHSGSFVWSDESFIPFIDSVKSTGPNQFIIRAQGGVGIGTNSPSDQLHVIGNIRASGCVIASNVTCPSDERLKTEIRKLRNPIERVGQLRGVEYRWTSSAQDKLGLPDGEQVGLIAQDVQKVVPQAVIEQSDGYLTVDYARLVPLLIEGMKEQQRQIEDLKARLDSQTP